MKTDSKIKLSNGRNLGFTEFGDPSGKPVFYFNGAGGSRLEKYIEDDKLHDLGVKVIGTDRPGHGLSDHYHNREILDWADDVIELADSLEIDKFHLLGWSAGGPHALACAYKYPDRIISGALAASVVPAKKGTVYQGYTPDVRLMVLSARRSRRIASLTQLLIHLQIKHTPEKLANLVVRFIPDVESDQVDDPELIESIIENMQEGYSQGRHGPAQDGRLVFNDWKFDIRKIETKFALWQGDTDKFVPIGHLDYLKARLPNHSVHIVKNKGHLFIMSELEEIFKSL